MYNKGGFNPRPDTSYQSPASKSARAKSKNKRKQILAAYTDFLVGNNRAAQAQQEMRSSFRQGDKEAGLKAAKEAAKFAKKRKSALEKGEKLFDKDLSEFKEYKGGGKMYGKKGMKVKKYQEGGMNATGETRKKRPLEGASFEEKRAANRADMAKATKKRLSSPTKSMTAYSLIMAGLPRAESKQQGEANINIAKMTAEKGVEGLLDYFKSDDWGGKVPPKEKVEQFVEKFGK